MLLLETLKLGRLTKILDCQEPTSNTTGAVSECQPEDGDLRVSGGTDGEGGRGGGVRGRRRWAVHGRAARLQLREHFGEEAGLRVDPQHVEGQSVDDEEATVPELIFRVFD